MMLTPTQQAVLSLLARYQREEGRYPTAAEIARELCLEIGCLPGTLRRLEKLGALLVAAPAGTSREAMSYDRRLTLIWSDERIAFGGAEQLDQTPKMEVQHGSFEW